jgi:hypothetical protein
VARKSPNESGPVWPPRLREYDPDIFATKLDWHWARLHANRDQKLGFDTLALLQAVAAATTDPGCNPFIRSPVGADGAAGGGDEA